MFLQTSIHSSSTHAVMRELWWERAPGYKCVEALIDSGAGECVCGPQHSRSTELKMHPNRVSAGAEHVCADGGRIPNQGEKSVNGLSDKLAVKFQVTAVDRPLLSVSKLTKTGHQVRYGHDVAPSRTARRVTRFTRRTVCTCLRSGFLVRLTRRRVATGSSQ